MCIDVVRDDQIDRAVFLAHPARAFLHREQKLGDRRNAALTGGGTDIHRRLDSKARYARRDDVLGQIAVVAGDFDHQRLVRQSESLDGLLDERLRVLHPAVRKRLEVSVFGERIFRHDERRAHRG